MIEPEKQHINKWDSPSEHDLFGREPFVDTIVKTIQSSKEGFNLGISARWGEGKSSILNQLKPKLEALNYKVLTFEPWEYTQDNISIKRKFIIDIYSQLGKKYDETELYGTTEKHKDLDIKEYDNAFANRFVLFIKYAGISAGVFALLLYFFQEFTGRDINITQIVTTNLFIPVLAGVLPIIAKLAEVNIKQTVPRIESAEQFEKLFNTAVDEIMAQETSPERIIIFVDDLDRCSHTEVEQILTALFTFFNNKHCTYIITADHTVIRRYISQFLKLEDEVSDNGQIDIKKTNEIRQKEATEYLKKIFQINFIVPKIPNDLLEEWLKKLLDETKVIECKNPYAKEYIVNLILNNFQGNPRKIKHFIRTLEFQLEAIGEKLARLEDGVQEKSNLQKVKDSPELLSKMLIFQDRFPDFYEKLINEPKLLQRYEGGEMADNTDLQNLIAQEPKFFNSVTRQSYIKTIDPYYFLYYSGSTGFIETKIIDPAEIKALARSADFDKLTKIISGLTDEPRNEQVEHIRKEFDAPEITEPEKVNIIRSLFHTISLIEEPTLKLHKFKDLIKETKKYNEQFKSLQSVDFDKILPFADTEIANILLNNTPFNEVAVQNQLVKTFISKQKDLDSKEVAELFVNKIQENIAKKDDNSSGYLGMINKLSDDNLKSSENLQNSLVSLYQSNDNPLKEQTWDIILKNKQRMSEDSQLAVENIIYNTLEKSPIGDVVTMVGLIPDKLSSDKIDIGKFTQTVAKRIDALSRSELEQLYNIIVHPKVKDGLGENNLEVLYKKLTAALESQDSDVKTFIRGKVPDILVEATDKKTLLKNIAKTISASSLAEGQDILNIMQGMSDFWNANKDLKVYFGKELKSAIKKSTDQEAKALMIRVSEEFNPSLKPDTKKQE